MRRSPNLWASPAAYETESHAFDPDGLCEQAMAAIASWSGRDVLDVGCGTGFHLPRFARTARTVTGVEPHAGLAAVARRRTRRLARVAVVAGTAQRLPLAEASLDVAHARWAYFFGPGCEPGIAELARVLRPGGTAFVIDNDPSRSEFGEWFRAGFPSVDPGDVAAFWLERGWRRTPVLTRWSFADRADLEQVVRIELPPGTAELVLADHHGLEVTYAVNVWWRTFPGQGPGRDR